MSSIDINELALIAAAELQKEIDAEVLYSMLETSGWTSVQLTRFKDRYHSVDVSEWANDNCVGKFYHSSTRYIFENEKDAIMFTLKWS